MDSSPNQSNKFSYFLSPVWKFEMSILIWFYACPIFGLLLIMPIGCKKLVFNLSHRISNFTQRQIK